MYLSYQEQYIKPNKIDINNLFYQKDHLSYKTWICQLSTQLCLYYSTTTNIYQPLSLLSCNNEDFASDLLPYVLFDCIFVSSKTKENKNKIIKLARNINRFLRKYYTQQQQQEEDEVKKAPAKEEDDNDHNNNIKKKFILY